MNLAQEAAANMLQLVALILAQYLWGQSPTLTPKVTLQSSAAPPFYRNNYGLSFA
jgi:hypothetical protein